MLETKELKLCLKQKIIIIAEEIDMQAQCISAELITHTNAHYIQPMFISGFLNQQNKICNDYIQRIIALLNSFNSKDGRNISLYLQQARIYLLLFRNVHLANYKIEEARNA